jgi:hypothetical protein
MYKTLIGTLLALLLAVPAEAQKPGARSSPSTDIERKNTGPTIPSGQVQQQVVKLNEQIHWFASLEEARVLARRENKSIFWLHALGDLDGIC